MIDVDFSLRLQDGRRHFELDACFSTDAPFAALYGPSGAGKSLTLQAIAGLSKPVSGRIVIDGRTLFDAARGIDISPPERRIGYLFQNYALFPHLSVRENIAFGLTSWRRRRPAPQDAARVQMLLERFGLAQMADSRPDKLSGGQQQRVALARALACEPRLLLLDEPFAALNPMLRGDLRKELAAVRLQWNIPVMMITHDVDDVIELADVALLFEQGRVTQQLDLRTGESRVQARSALVGEPAPETPLRKSVRATLTGLQGDSARERG